MWHLSVSINAIIKPNDNVASRTIPVYSPIAWYLFTLNRFEFQKLFSFFPFIFYFYSFMLHHIYPVGQTGFHFEHFQLYWILMCSLSNIIQQIKHVWGDATLCGLWHDICQNSHLNWKPDSISNSCFPDFWWNIICYLKWSPTIPLFF